LDKIYQRVADYKSKNGATGTSTLGEVTDDGKWEGVLFHAALNGQYTRQLLSEECRGLILAGIWKFQFLHLSCISLSLKKPKKN